ncbi:Gem-associated protein 5 [Homalodisca vitripennis]|nr:Gem-associated protein 5 [Homalodisca vitripennis]KAG8258386.1 Gem-associated protein 5 [Homalodisca vitripennis]
MQQLGMDNFILPASPNWQLSSVLACNDNGLIAYGSRSDVSIINFKPNGKFEVSILQFAHKDRLSTIVFSPVDGKFKNCLATCGDDGMVRLWNFEEGRLLYFHSGHKASCGLVMISLAARSAGASLCCTSVFYLYISPNTKVQHIYSSSHSATQNASASGHQRGFGTCPALLSTKEKHPSR